MSDNWAGVQAERALATGDLLAAQRWLAYAWRRRPGDLGIALRLGTLRLRLRDPAARDIFRLLAETHELREGWFGLAAAALQAGEFAAAAAHLACGLSRHPPLRDPGFAGFCQRVARFGGAGGWCGLSGEGVLRLGFADGRARVPVLRIDGVLSRARPVLHDGLITFRLGRALRGRQVLEVLDDGRHLLGSPIVLAAVLHFDDVAPADEAGDGTAHHRPLPPPQRRAIDVVIPVYRGARETFACIAAVLGSVDAQVGVVVVDDATPDAELARGLDVLAGEGRIRLIRHARNRGFPAAANAGLRATAERDVVLLNSDVLVANDWLARLQAAALSAPDIATVTPFTNDGSLLGYPHRDRGSPPPQGAALAVLDRQARRANGGRVVEIPTAVGFCMYIRRDCLDAVGLLREDAFAHGYGEENDFCLRARRLGWRHVALPGVFVSHIGATSFGAAKAALQARNIAVLERLHPGYQALVERFGRADRLAPARRRLDRQRWRAADWSGGAVLLITHARGGGVARRVRARCAELLAEGMRPVLLTPVLLTPALLTPVLQTPVTREGHVACAVDNSGADYPNLVYALPQQAAALLATLREARPAYVELHHFIDHHPMLLGLAGQLGLPLDIVVHDYAWFCPRISLSGAGHRYCGEPELAACETCVAALGNPLGDLTPGALRARSAAMLAQARRIIVPSHDTARRLQRHFPQLATECRPWEVDSTAAPVHRPRRAGDLRICVAGAIGRHKGYETLLALALDVAARDLPMHYFLVGHSHDDLKLLQTGAISITGPFEDAECLALLRAQSGDCGFLPSDIPETWCYALSELWRAGLAVAAFDIGAPAERIRATGRGILLPLGLPVARVNEALLTWKYALARPAGPD